MKLLARTPEENARAMSDMAKMLCEVRGWIECNTLNADDRFVYSNLLSASADNLNIFAEGTNGHISIPALATRNLFEIYIQTIDISRSPAQMHRWKGESITDDIEVLERFISSEYVRPGEEEKKALNTRIRKLKSDRKELGFSSNTPEPIVEIAKRVKQKAEYATLYKHYSKLIHPTSYLVNNYEAASTKKGLILLQIFALRYAVKTFAIIFKVVGMPKNAVHIPESVVLK